ncbi:MAG: hypothetical protein A2351_04415 [Omnitrophica bacterium RIFOXYB12_FULL_50_7]|nr:MAG: hypothetical protein A2351_04415 [Omnitrophica bacterium RIFOXYB12_FULL_50_7]
MTKTALLTSYAALRKKVKETLLLGQQRIEAAKVRAYWETGCFINQHIQVNGGRAEYGQKIVRRLAEDIELHYSVLQKCSQFAEMFPDFRIVSARRQLTWAHFRALLAVPDEKKRLELLARADQENWVSRDLEIEVRNLNWERRAEIAEGKLSLLPVPVLGPFYTYQVIAPQTVHSSSRQLLLDLGFSARFEMEIFLPAKFPVGTIVTSTKDAKGRYSLRSVPSPRPLPKGEDKGEGESDDRPKIQTQASVLKAQDSLLYTYKAFIQRFIDADTYHVEFRLGFGQLREETIRLRGIDCPEMDTPEGQAAKRFVERELAHCEFITIKSTQTRKEKWGRYLGDIFYTDKSGKLQYLNNLLLEKGHAVRVRD